MSDTQLATVQSKAPVVMGERGLRFNSIESLHRFCVAVSNSKEFGNITPEQAMMRIQAGAELGLSPVWSLANIFYYQGKPTVWGDALLGLALADPRCEDVIECDLGKFPNDDYTARCEVKHKGRAPIIRTFSVADAKRAGIFERNVHKPYPKRMLQMRARGFALRDAFADRFRGLGMREELEDIPQANAREVNAPPKLQFADEPIQEEQPAPESEPTATEAPEKTASARDDLKVEERDLWT